MLLVHLRLRPRAGSPELSASAVQAATTALAADDAIEHVSVHAHDLSFPVLGAYVNAPDPAAAEAAAQAAWQRVVTTHACLAAFVVLECQAMTQRPQLRLPGAAPPR